MKMNVPSPDALLTTVLANLAIIRGPNSRGDYTGWCPFHNDGNGKPPHEPNLSVGPNGFICHACGEKGSLRRLAERLGVAMSEVRSCEEEGRIASWYDYKDERGQLVYQVGRKIPKGFVQRRPNGTGGYHWNLHGVRPLLYMLPELIADPDAIVWIVEGEKDADRLRLLGLTATTNSGGAGKWHPEHSASLRGRHVVILPDNDHAGQTHAQKIASSLVRIAASVKVINLPGLVHKGDISDWLNSGHTLEELQSLMSDSLLFEEERATPNHPSRKAVIVNLGEVQPEPVSWLWRRYIPIGKLTILEGDPGIGKTSVALAIAAMVTRGYPFPDVGGGADDSREPAGVVYLSAEDGLADTLRPRLDACGANPNLVHAITGIRVVQSDGTESEQAISLQDIPVLDEALTTLKPVLVIVDPLQAYIGAKVDIHRANETRPVLAALASLAEKHRCAVLCIRHLGKSSQDRAVYRGLGSIDFAAAARSILLAAQSPADPDLRVLAHVKHSLSSPGKSLAFQLSDGGFYWKGTSELTADDLLGAPVNREERTAIDEAVQFLEDVLSCGPRLTKLIKRDAKREKISEASLRRAKDKLGVVAACQGASQTGKRTEWVWKLPDQVAQPSPIEPDEHLEFSSDVIEDQRIGLLKQDAHVSNIGLGESLNLLK